MHRFFLESGDQVSGSSLIIKSPETYNHMVRVLRIALGECVECVLDQVYIAKVESIGKEAVELVIEAILPFQNESSVKIDLIQCLPKGPKLEYIIQKNVELGVRDFYLVESSRCVVTWKGKDSDKKVERYEKIAKEAAKQSKRDVMPNVFGVLSFIALKEHLRKYDLSIVLYENEEDLSLKALAQNFNGSSIAIVVGPEGGFDVSEMKALSEVAKIATLGKRILRTETAGMVAVTCLQYEFNELG